MALQEQALSTWMKGLLYQATAVFERELAGTNPLRAADMIFKHLGGLLALGGNAADARTADATALARELFKAAGINININTKGDSEPEVKVIERDQS